MKAEQLSRTYWLAVFFVVVWFCLTCPVNAQEPEPGGTPTVVHNADGSTTTTEAVDSGKPPNKHAPTPSTAPFWGKGVKRTTTDKDGKIVSVEWFKKGKLRIAVFFKTEGPKTVVTRYRYKDDGKTVEGKDQSAFWTLDGKLASKEDESYDSKGELDDGSVRFVDGKWERWSTQENKWIETKPPIEAQETLEDLRKQYGAEAMVLPRQGQQVSVAGPGQGWEHAMRGVRQATGRWSLQFGALAQTSNVDFAFSHKAENFGLISAGSTDFFTGDGTVTYADGSISFDSVSDPFKLARFSGGSVEATGTRTIGAATVDTIDVTFHSTVIAEQGGTQSREESFGKYAPYVQLSCKIAEANWGSVSIFSQYAFYDKNQSSGVVGGGFFGDVHMFVYQGIDQMIGPDLVVYDPTVLNNPPFNATPPFSFPIDMISALRLQSSGTLDLQQHVFTVGVRAKMSLWDRYHLFAAAGPTLTHSCVDFKARTDLWMGDVRLATHEFSDSSHDFQLGFMFQTGVEIDLWRNVSLEVFGRYDWSDKLEVGDEQARAELGNNSIGGGVGIKFTF